MPFHFPKDQEMGGISFQRGKYLFYRSIEGKVYKRNKEFDELEGSA